MSVGTGFCIYDVIIKKFTFAISSPDEFLFNVVLDYWYNNTVTC